MRKNHKICTKGRRNPVFCYILIENPLDNMDRKCYTMRNIAYEDLVDEKNRKINCFHICNMYDIPISSDRMRKEF